MSTAVAPDLAGAELPAWCREAIVGEFVRLRRVPGLSEDVITEVSRALDRIVAGWLSEVATGPAARPPDVRRTW